MVTTERDRFARSVASDGAAFVLFTTPGCAGCAAQRETLRRVTTRHDIQTVEVDADEQSRLAAEFQITSVPTTLVFVDGVQRRRLIGSRSDDEITGALDGAIPLNADETA